MSCGESSLSDQEFRVLITLVTFLSGGEVLSKGSLQHKMGTEAAPKLSSKILQLKFMQRSELKRAAKAAQESTKVEEVSSYIQY